MSDAAGSSLCSQWGSSPMFRLLALLDTTGIQNFDFLSEVRSDTGAFLRPDHLLRSHPLRRPSEEEEEEKKGTPNPTGRDDDAGEPSPFAKILQASTISFLRNALLHFSPSVQSSRLRDHEEQQRAAPEEEKQRMTQTPLEKDISAALFYLVKDSDNQSDINASSKRDHSLTASLASFENKVTRPLTLTTIEDALVDCFSEEVREVLLEWFLSTRASSSARSHSTSQPIYKKKSDDNTSFTPPRLFFSSLSTPHSMFAEQFLIDGLHEWLSQPIEGATPSLPPPSTSLSGEALVVDPTQPWSVLQQMVLSCGGAVSPAVVLPIVQDNARRYLLEDFLYDVLFPLPLQRQEETTGGSEVGSKNRKRKNTPRGKKATQKKEEEEKETSAAPNAVVVLEDWLLQVYVKNRMRSEEDVGTIEIKEENWRVSCASDTHSTPQTARLRDEEEGDAEPTASKRRKVETARAPHPPRQDRHETVQTRTTNHMNHNNSHDNNVDTAAQREETTPYGADERHRHVSLPSRNEAAPSSSPPLSADAVVMPPPPPALTEAGADPCTAATTCGSSRAGGTEEEKEDDLVTSENVMEYMFRSPKHLPAATVCQLRKSYKDPNITAWELDHHYKIGELRAIVKEEIEAREEAARSILGRGNGEGESKEVEQVNEEVEIVEIQPVKPEPLLLSEKEWVKAKRASKKKEYIAFLMALYKRNETNREI